MIFADKIEHLAHKPHFVDNLKQILQQFLGRSSATAVIYHIGGDVTLQDPEVFEEKMRAFFGIGAETIFQHILKNIVPSEEDDEVFRKLFQ